MNQEKTEVSSTNKGIIGLQHHAGIASASLECAELDPRSLWNRVNHDPELLRNLVRIFTGQYPELLRQMEKAIAEGASSALQRASHKLRGSALQLSAREAATLAKTLEEMGQQKSLEGAPEIFRKLAGKIDSLIEQLNLMVNDSLRGES